MKEILSKIFFCPPEFVNNVLLHIPVGLVTVGLAFLNGWLCLVFGLGFIFYELSEERKINDTAFQDIKGWLFGIGILGVILLWI
jgi:hypothetical protein